MLSLPMFLIPCGALLPESMKQFLDRREIRYYDYQPGAAVKESQAGIDNPQRILDWDQIKAGFRWEILFVFGGGAMIAHGTTQSGLAAWAAETLGSIQVSKFVFIFVVTIIVTFVTII